MLGRSDSYMVKIKIGFIFYLGIRIKFKWSKYFNVKNKKYIIIRRNKVDFFII